MYKKAYTRLDTVKGALGLSCTGDANVDSFIERQIIFYSELFNRRCSRTFYYKDDITFKAAVNTGQKRIVLPDVPVEEVFSVKYNADVVDEAEYFIEDKKLGFLTKRHGVWRDTAGRTPNVRKSPPVDPVKLYTVNYSGGYVTPKQAEEDPAKTRSLPYDIEEAVIRGVVSGVNQRGVDEAVDALSVGDGSVSFGSSEGARNVPDFFNEVVNTYKRIGVM